MKAPQGDDLHGTVRDLLRRGFYSMAFQPIRETAGCTVFGYEALFRGPRGTPLCTPRRLFHKPGLLSDDLMHKLDLACVGAAIRTGRRFSRAHRLFINIHGVTLLRLARESAVLFDLLESLGVPPESLVLEISENTEKAHARAIAKSLQVFRRRGMQVALDDVGVCYPWLHHLLILEPDFMKIDRSFIQDIHQQPRKQEVINGLLALGQHAGSRLVAEGVENQEEWEVVRGLEIPYAQGFWLGRPQPAERWASAGEKMPSAPGVTGFHLGRARGSSSGKEEVQ